MPVSRGIVIIELAITAMWELVNKFIAAVTDPPQTFRACWPLIAKLVNALFNSPRNVMDAALLYEPGSVVS